MSQGSDEAVENPGDVLDTHDYHRTHRRILAPDDLFHGFGNGRTPRLEEKLVKLHVWKAVA
jgi:hypothetical protein